MPKYKVCLQRYLEFTAKIEIEAETPEAAKDAVQSGYAFMNPAWDHGDDATKPEAYAVLDEADEAVWER